MKHFSFSCQGESHKLTNKPCQDSSLSYSEDGLSIAIVCDGHGGERYFRSDVGSRLCTKITEEAIKQFVSNVDKNLFLNKPFTQKKAISETDTFDKLNDTDKVLRHLFSSIILAWNTEVELHAKSNPPSESECEKVPLQYLEALRNNVSLEKIYGCTLMAYVQTSEYWFAFHLGDGKCISFHDEEPNIWKEPIPWDERCFLNKTTSICDSAALDEFRFCYQGDGNFPTMIILGSDGMDDSFGPIENMVDFYMQIAKLLFNEGELETQESLKETLPALSKRGSQDDMSIAYIYNSKKLDALVPQIISQQIEKLEVLLSKNLLQINELENKVHSLENSNEQKDIIELNYAIKDIEKLKNTRASLEIKLESRNDELCSLKSIKNDCTKERINNKKYKRLNRKRKKRKHKKNK